MAVLTLLTCESRMSLLIFLGDPYLPSRLEQEQSCCPCEQAKLIARLTPHTLCTMQCSRRATACPLRSTANGESLSSRSKAAHDILAPAFGRRGEHSRYCRQPIEDHSSYDAISCEKTAISSSVGYDCVCAPPCCELNMGSGPPHCGSTTGRLDPTQTNPNWVNPY